MEKCWRRGREEEGRGKGQRWREEMREKWWGSVAFIKGKTAPVQGCCTWAFALVFVIRTTENQTFWDTYAKPIRMQCSGQTSTHKGVGAAPLHWPKREKIWILGTRVLCQCLCTLNETVILILFVMSAISMRLGFSPFTRLGWPWELCHGSRCGYDHLKRVQSHHKHIRLTMSTVLSLTRLDSKKKS